MATTWTPIASVVQTTIPNDITGNSLSLAPVSGDSTAVGLSLGNGSSTLFSVNASGNVSAAAASLAGTLTVSGTTSLGAASVTSMTNSGQMTAKNAQVSGNGTASAPAYSYTGQTDTGPYLATASTSAAVLGFAVNGTQALSMTKLGISVPGTLSVTGATTLGNATVGNLTTNGLTNTGSGTAAGLFSSISGTASAPSFSYTNQTDTGLYLATQSATAAVLGLAVNGTQAVSLSKGGVSVPGTFGVTGATTLAGTSTGALSVSGNETVSGTLGVTGATTLGTLSAGASTLTSVATTSLGPVTSPPHTFVGQTDTGFYLPTQSSTAAIMGLAVNGTQSLALSKSGITVPGTLNVTGASTLSGNTTFGGALSSTGNLTANALFTSSAGSASAPVISNTNYTSTGIYFSSTPAVVITASGTGALNCSASAVNALLPLNVTGAAVATGNVTGNALITTATGSQTSPVFTSTISNTTGMYISSTPSVVLTASGTGVFSANTSAVTASAPLVASSTLAVTGAAALNSTLTVTGATTTKATVTSQTAVGTASFVSTNGFRFSVAGTYWRTSYVANNAWTVTQTQFDTNAGSSAANDLKYAFPVSGSVVGLSLVQNGSSTGTNSLSILKNGSTLYTWSPGTNNTGVPYYIAITKNTYAFAAGDVLSLVVANTASGEIKMQVWAFIEMLA